MKYFLFLSLQIIFMSPTLGFLFFYHKNFHIPHNILLTHAQLIFFITLGWISLILSIGNTRVSFYKTLKIPVFLWFFVTISIYACMIMGLSSWGKIPTTDILKVYLKQLDATLQAIGASIWSIALLLILFLAIITLLSYCSLIIFKILIPQKNR